MSYASGTPFLNLPQTDGSDHRDWFDTNEPFLDLDTKLKTLWDGSASTETILTALQESVATLSTDVSTLSGIVSGHTSTITTINESLVLINTALNALNTQVVGKFDSVGIADAYDATHGIYAVGDVVTYNGQRYVCTTAVTAAEPFDVSKWIAKDIQAELDELSQSEISLKKTITADGVKNWGQLLTELYNDATALTGVKAHTSYIILGAEIYRWNGVNTYGSCDFWTSDDGVSIGKILFNANVGAMIAMSITASGNSIISMSAVVPAAGTLIQLYSA